ncbi:hypothetical protein TNCV_1138231 [Trichonephila clavipes]|nr:hypothetical protein TNCV_1138231 [Trichonephila clavipes]
MFMPISNALVASTIHASNTAIGHCNGKPRQDMKPKFRGGLNAITYIFTKLIPTVLLRKSVIKSHWKLFIGILHFRNTCLLDFSGSSQRMVFQMQSAFRPLLMRSP